MSRFCALSARVLIFLLKYDSLSQEGVRSFPLVKKLSVSKDSEFFVEITVSWIDWLVLTQRLPLLFFVIMIIRSNNILLVTRLAKR